MHSNSDVNKQMEILDQRSTFDIFNHNVKNINDIRRSSILTQNIPVNERLFHLASRKQVNFKNIFKLNKILKIFK